MQPPWMSACNNTVGATQVPELKFRGFDRLHVGRVGGKERDAHTRTMQIPNPKECKASRGICPLSPEIQPGSSQGMHDEMFYIKGFFFKLHLLVSQSPYHQF